jgi:UDP-N-acetylglucosamine/UDP-N-acetylgalactosamine diphosphorylase
VVETRRSEQFSPVKNATGVDSAVSCKQHQLRLFARWMHAAGIPVPVDAEGVPTIEIEISPLFAVDEDSFAESWKKLNPKPDLRNGLILA